MEEAPTPAKQGHGAAWAIGSILVLVLYLLSPVPVAVAIMASSGSTPPPGIVGAYSVFYFPIIWASQNCEPIGQFYNAYGTWAAKTAGLHPP